MHGQTILDKLRISELYNIGNQLKMTPKNVLDVQNLGTLSYYVATNGNEI